MPISEDEYDHKTQHHGMSKAEQRRSNKPIMEKRRRARINHCLNELKALILDAMKKDPARHSKLEKADILEMTVKHLQTIQRQQLAVAVATDPTVLHKFKTGFNECATEVSRYISRIEGVEPSVKQRLVAHLANCISGLQQLSPFAFANNNALNTITNMFPGIGTSALHLPLQQGPNAPSSTTGLPTILPHMTPGDVNNNHHSAGRLQMSGGLQLIPSRLPTGELALLLPNSGQLPGNVLPFFPPPAATQGTSTTTSTTSTATAASTGPSSTVTSGSIDRSHLSAFTAVARVPSPVTVHNRPRSPSFFPQNFGMVRMKSGSPAPLSPTTSISSCDTTDTYPSPNTPPPTQSLINTQSVITAHQQITSQSYPSTVSSNQFKVPLENPSGYNIFHFPTMEPQKPPPSPQQQPLVTSTSSPASDIVTKVKPSAQPADSSTSSSGLLSTVTEVKLEFKTLPVTTRQSISNINIPPSTSLSSITTSNHPLQHSFPVNQPIPVDQCLSVITNGSAFIDRQHNTTKDALDFSVKKDDFQTVPMQSLIGTKRHISMTLSSGDSSSEHMPQCYPSSNKVLRFSFMPNEMPQKTSPKPKTEVEEGLLKCSDSKSHLSVVVEDLSNKPSTSSAVVTTSSTAQTGSKDMWRPW